MNNYYSDAATQIVGRCKEIYHTRVGLFLLITGFSCQLIAQFLPNEPMTSILATTLTLSILLILIGLCLLIAIRFDEKLKKDALVEFINRMLPNSLHNDTLNLPVGMPISNVENVCNIFLKRKLSFSIFPQFTEKEQRTPLSWAILERSRRLKNKKKK